MEYRLFFNKTPPTFDKTNFVKIMKPSFTPPQLRIFLASILVLSTCTLFAQFTGTNPLTTTSNVNIQSPGNDAALDVGGAGDSATVQITTPWVTPTSYVGPFRIRGTNYIINGPTTYFPLFCVAPNGNVGLKTETPSELLTLNGGNALALNGNFTASSGNFVAVNGCFKTQNSLGTTNFKVDEDGLLIARRIDVHLDPIPDYVFHAAFNKDSAAFYDSSGFYKFMTLQQVDSFVQTNKHLPGIKSANEYQQAGAVNVGELQLLLLQKVEELTLYNIQLMKEIEELKKKQVLLEQRN
ncbi:MAG: hypothetical protein IT247_03620 [Bacteroidia bacterium]|nr:hypothetical protein [Bacteroidia bacterium]